MANENIAFVPCSRRRADRFDSFNFANPIAALLPSQLHRCSNLYCAGIVLDIYNIVKSGILAQASPISERRAIPLRKVQVKGDDDAGLRFWEEGDRKRDRKNDRGKDSRRRNRGVERVREIEREKWRSSGYGGG